MLTLADPIDTLVREELKEHDDLIASLLARRGIKTKAEADVFLSPSYDAHIGDPFLILNMRKAAGRIASALASQERITVWSDYDCDGIPGGVVLHDFLKKAGANFDNYIPHRHLEGYGLNIAGIEKLALSGTTLIITVDSGITDVEQVKRANELGIDVIITDHHLPQNESEGGLPPAYAVIDPKQAGETNEFRDFCGGGLAWKLSCAVLAIGREENAKWTEAIPLGWEKWLLDMAALSTIADMVPLTGENRVIARYGLLVMRKSPRIGFQKLLRAARVDQRSITEDDVGFMIAPRINAASRMGNPRDAFELLSTDDEVRAGELAKELEKINRSRRALAGSITRAVNERLAERKLQGELPPVIALGDPDWRPGLLGLVANTISEEHERPVFLWGREGGTTLKGSCRAGASGISVVELMQGAPDVFAGFGGHKASGGFTIIDEAVFHFEERLNKAFASLLARPAAEPPSADAELSLDHATDELLLKLSRLAPFGMGNEKPVFAFRNVPVMRVAWFGKANEHLKLVVEGEFGRVIEGIAFYARRSLGKRSDQVKLGDRISILASLERDQFSRGRPVRLRLISIS